MGSSSSGLAQAKRRSSEGGMARTPSASFLRASASRASSTDAMLFIVGWSSASRTCPVSLEVSPGAVRGSVTVLDDGGGEKAREDEKSKFIVDAGAGRCRCEEGGTWPATPASQGPRSSQSVRFSCFLSHDHHRDHSRRRRSMFCTLLVSWLWLLHCATRATAVYLGQEVLSRPRTTSVLRRFTVPPPESSGAHSWNVHDILAAAQVSMSSRICVRDVLSHSDVAFAFALSEFSRLTWTCGKLALLTSMCS